MTDPSMTDPSMTTILCGTDFSPEGTSALRVAFELAARMNAPLHLAHAVALAGYDWVDEATRAELANGHRRRLESQAEELRKPGQQVTFHVLEGPADDVLLKLAGQTSASLVVIGALGTRTRPQWQLGSQADRVAQRAHVPVLTVRGPDALLDWARGDRPLRIVLGADLTASAAAAMRWVDALARFGRCEVIAAHCYWPPEQYARLGLGGVRDYIEPVPEVTETLERELEAHFARAASPGSSHGPLRFRIEPHLGRVGDRIAAIAAEEQADLVVVGSHDRGAARLWEGSVSRLVLQQASVSVACVPAPRKATWDDIPSLKSVLVATDFSATGDAAIALAYGAAAPGAVVHLVHVAPGPLEGAVKPRDIFPSPSPAQRDRHHDTRERLGRLVPSAAQDRQVRTELHVLESHEAADAICQAAERLGVDLICLGTHGRSGLAKRLLGSVAHDVLAKSHRPILLARKPAL